MLRFMGSQRVGHDLATELNCTVVIQRMFHIIGFPIDYILGLSLFISNSNTSASLS